MSHHYIHAIVPRDRVDDIIELADRDGVHLSGISAAKGPVRTVYFLASPKAQQGLLDDLQSALYKSNGWRIAMCPVDAVVSKSSEEEDKAHENNETREELLSEISRNASITPTYITLVIISAIVAALGMVENNIAAIIGAMVIAPLLGPILGGILGVSLGERKLIAKASKAGIVGIGLAIAVGAALGALLRFEVTAAQLAARASVGFDDIALALAAGTAAALSLTAGVASILVGVMVAVALIPPATAIGLFLGKTAWLMAGEAALLLSVNLVALHLSGQVVLLVRGVKPRTRYRRAKVKQSVRFSLIVSAALLLLLAALILEQIWS